MVEFEDLFHISTPCDKLQANDPLERVRHCSSCDREILNLSALTRAEAIVLVSAERLHCAAYWVDEHGVPVFADEMLLEDESTKLKQLGQSLWRHAQVLSLPMLLAACEPADPAASASAVEVSAISVQEPAAKLEHKQGAASLVKAPTPGELPDTKVLSTPVSYNDKTEAVSRVTLKQSLYDLELLQEARNQRMNKGKRKPAHRDVGLLVSGR